MRRTTRYRNGRLAILWAFGCESDARPSVGKARRRLTLSIQFNWPMCPRQDRATSYIVLISRLDEPMGIRSHERLKEFRELRVSSQAATRLDRKLNLYAGQPPRSANSHQNKRLGASRRWRG